MTSVPNIYRILPEVILTLTGVVIMLLEASLPPAWRAPPLGWVAAIGTTIALWASLWQLSLPEGTGFFSTVETSAFTVFFHVLICGIVLPSFCSLPIRSPKAAITRASFTRSSSSARLACAC